MAKLLPSVTWEIENIYNELDLIKVIPMQNVRGVKWFILLMHNKNWIE